MAKPASALSSIATSGQLSRKRAHDALQEGHRRVAGVGGARPQDRRDEVPGLAVEDEQGMVHVLPEVAVVGAPFLVAVGRIVGGVEVQEAPSAEGSRPSARSRR